MRPLFAALLLSASSTLACDTVARSVEFLGWTEDSSFFVWKVIDRAVCKEGPCPDPWIAEVIRVTDNSSASTEYLIRFTSKLLQPPPFAPAKDWLAWKASHTLAKVSTSPVSPVEPETTLLATAKVPLKQQGNVFFAPKSDKAVPFELTVKSSHQIDPQRWRGGPASCGQARGYWSPDGHHVAWLTSPPKSTCAECEGSLCCPYPEGRSLAVRW